MEIWNELKIFTNANIAYISVILLLINMLAFFLYYLDKRRAIEHRQRISESTLINCAILFGALGAFAGMRLFHHKTRHMKFAIFVPLLLVIQITIIILLVI